MNNGFELVRNAAGRDVPVVVNGQKQVPFLGIGKHQPEGRKAAPPVRIQPAATSVCPILKLPCGNAACEME